MLLLFTQRIPRKQIPLEAYDSERLDNVHKYAKNEFCTVTRYSKTFQQKGQYKNFQ